MSCPDNESIRGILLLERGIWTLEGLGTNYKCMRSKISIKFIKTPLITELCACLLLRYWLLGTDVYGWIKGFQLLNHSICHRWQSKSALQPPQKHKRKDTATRFPRRHIITLSTVAVVVGSGKSSAFYIVQGEFSWPITFVYTLKRNAVRRSYRGKIYELTDT